MAVPIFYISNFDRTLPTSLIHVNFEIRSSAMFFICAGPRQLHSILQRAPRTINDLPKRQQALHRPNCNWRSLTCSLTCHMMSGSGRTRRNRPRLRYRLTNPVQSAPIFDGLLLTYLMRHDDLYRHGLKKTSRTVRTSAVVSNSHDI